MSEQVRVPLCRCAPGVCLLHPSLPPGRVPECGMFGKYVMGPPSALKLCAGSAGAIALAAEAQPKPKGGDR